MPLKINILAIIFIAFLQLTHGQSNKEKAHDIGMQAIQYSKKGDYSKSLELLKEARKLDPENIVYSYEIALAHTYKKEYKKSIKILNKLRKSKDVHDKIYQLIGVNYSLNGQANKAIEFFDKGLKKFPNSGILHLERGNMELYAEEYSSALSYYEKGIIAEPSFPSNYYWASKLYCSSSESVWGLIYGEIFMNLERNSKRTAEISQLLFDTYKSKISFTSDTSMSAKFCDKIIVDVSNFNDSTGFKMPFCMIFGTSILLAIINEKEINISSLDRIRQTFIDHYFSSDSHNTHPNILFEYQKKIKQAGHIEAYNHWILMKGDPKGYEEWYLKNEEKWEAFIDWFTENRIKIDKNNYFHRKQY